HFARLWTWLALALAAACSSTGGVTLRIAQVGDSEFVLYGTGDAVMPLATRWGGDEVNAPQPWRLTQHPSSDGAMIVAIADADGRCLEAPMAIGAPMRLAPCDDNERQQFRVAGFDISPSGSPNSLIDPPDLSGLLRRDGFVIRARAVDGCVGVARDERSSPIGVALLPCEDAGGWTRYRATFNR
ncbi:MAG: hypothetical protein ABL932_11325, partial [Terricaulis sp.]